MEVEPVQLMNQLLTQLATEPSTEIHPTPFTGIATDNILGWLKYFDEIAVHSVSNDKKSHTCLHKGQLITFIAHYETK